jgi:MAF protein
VSILANIPKMTYLHGLWKRLGECVRIARMRAKPHLERAELSSNNPELILASTSPRRRQLMGLGGWMFNIIPAEVDETPFPGESPQTYVVRLAEAKARFAAQAAPSRAIVIAADTTVADHGRILGKPKDVHEATTMLKNLRGHIHQVFTALAGYQPANNSLETALAATDVPMRDYSDAEIQAYVATGDPFDKAGSYAIQHPDFRPVERLSGCYANVVGLPLCHLSSVLKKFGITPQPDIPLACQKTLQYQCDVFTPIIKGEL